MFTQLESCQCIWLLSLKTSFPYTQKLHLRKLPMEQWHQNRWLRRKWNISKSLILGLTFWPILTFLKPSLPQSNPVSRLPKRIWLEKLLMLNLPPIWSNLYLKWQWCWLRWAYNASISLPTAHQSLWSQLFTPQLLLSSIQRLIEEISPQDFALKLEKLYLNYLKTKCKN